MPESELNDTQPNASVSGSEPSGTAPAEGKKFPAWAVIVVIVLLIAVGLLSGYGSGMIQRMSAQRNVLAGQNQEQYQLGMEALQAGQYDIAKQHFDAVIQNDPNYPGVKDAYVELMIRMQTSPTPLFTPTSLYTGTPDPRGAAELFKSAQQLINSSSWDEALATLDNLRKADVTYQTAQVDGMYYIALRQRGIGKIINTDCKSINLEGGIYDLTLAERFVGSGNLDASAESLRTWARMYITGASFWDTDWEQAQNYFAQVKSALPNLSDSSCKTATERWRDATVELALQKMAAGKVCDAESLFNDAFSVTSPNNQPYYATATAVADQCSGGNGSSNPPPAETATPGGEAPTLTETPTP